MASNLGEEHYGRLGAVELAKVSATQRHVVHKSRRHGRARLDVE